MWGDHFTEDLSEFRQIYLKIQALVGKVMASLWIGITQRLPLYGSAARSQHRIAFAFCYTELMLFKTNFEKSKGDQNFETTSPQRQNPK
ncbi:hypothetical protein LEP1GSC038_0157 [Leptospira weilii str. 2006001855]|uniref:Uncharacterized protein n=1 Tax=Leptospira weilii str. 2006001855 TaxID=996804 RepID=M6FMT6_9LEPT|nr:hypothetical protein LEP1GSC038_0157 [Leptospira weilii str. 2006001855]